MRTRIFAGVSFALALLALGGCTNGTTPSGHTTFLVVEEVDPDYGKNTTWPKLQVNMTELDARVPALARAIRTADNGTQGHVRGHDDVQATWAYLEEKLGRPKRGTTELRLDGKAFLLNAVS